jgi:hypothetical protein
MFSMTVIKDKLDFDKYFHVAILDDITDKRPYSIILCI